MKQTSSNRPFVFTALWVAMCAVFLVSCSSGPKIPGRNSGLLSGGKATTTSSVNRYLWSASLETLHFMPLASQDPVSGVIVSDWYGNPQVPQERFKAQVYILDTALRADALRVAVFKQQLTPAGWIDAPVNPATAQEIENAILTRARDLRLNSIE